MRGFEMPPHARMSLVQQLLLRGLVARFWNTPYDAEAGSLGHRAARPLHAAALRRAGLPGRARRAAAGRACRLRTTGSRRTSSSASPRSAASPSEASIWSCARRIEPWHVLGEEASGGGTARYVDSSVERLAGQGQRADRRPARRHLQRPARAACIRPGPTASSWPASATGLAAAVVPAPDHPGALAPGLRSSGHLDGAVGRRLHLPCGRIPAAGRTTRSRSTPTRPRAAATSASVPFGHTPGRMHVAAARSVAEMPAHARPAAAHGTVQSSTEQRLRTTLHCGTTIAWYMARACSRPLLSYPSDR